MASTMNQNGREVPRRVQRDVALEDAQLWIIGQSTAEIKGVIDRDIVALCQQPRAQDMADIAGATCDENVLQAFDHWTTTKYLKLWEFGGAPHASSPVAALF